MDLIKHFAHPIVQMGKLSRDKEQQWQVVADACRFEGDLEPECIKVFFEHLDNNNHLEWSIWLSEYFDAQLWLVLFGWLAALQAPFDAFIVLVFGLKPDLSEAPWQDVGILKGLWYFHITLNAWLIQSFMYFWSQVFTLGGSHLSDFQLIYMTHAEAGLYIFSEMFIIPILLPGAFLWVFVNWWMYLIWLLYEAFQILERMNIPKYEDEISEMQTLSR